MKMHVDKTVFTIHSKMPNKERKRLKVRKKNNERKGEIIKKTKKRKEKERYELITRWGKKERKKKEEKA